jgi:purine-binding chemotaxis protein CheW
MARNAVMEKNLHDGASHGADGREDEQFLTFRLGGEVFAMGILGIKEILEFGRLTTVPMMPPSVRGVINLRGRVVPVVDLALRFGRAATEPGRRTCIVIVDLETENGRQDIGVVVDAVNQVLEIPKSDIEPAPSFGARLRPDFVAGMGEVGGDFVVILDTARVLALDELADVTRSAGTRLVEHGDA